MNRIDPKLAATLRQPADLIERGLAKAADLADLERVAARYAIAVTPDIAGLMARVKDAEQAGDLDRVNAIKAHHWLDGPLQPEGRVTGEARRLFLDMNAIALRSPPIGSNLDVAPAFHRLGAISVPSLVIWGDLDFPHIQERCRHIAMTMPNGSGHMLTGTAHLPSLERPAEITNLVAAFIDGCSGQRATR